VNTCMPTAIRKCRGDLNSGMHIHIRAEDTQKDYLDQDCMIIVEASSCLV